jgi:hypothetical protein
VPANAGAATVVDRTTAKTERRIWFSKLSGGTGKAKRNGNRE